MIKYSQTHNWREVLLHKRVSQSAQAIPAIPLSDKFGSYEFLEAARTALYDLLALWKQPGAWERFLFEFVEQEELKRGLVDLKPDRTRSPPINFVVDQVRIYSLLQ